MSESGIETRIALGVNQRSQVWQSHTGYLFKWGEASNTWLSKAPGTVAWVDMHIRTAFADAGTPFVLAADGV